MLARLARLDPEREFAPRISLPAPYHECAVAESDSLVPAVNCLRRAGKPSRGFDELKGDASRRLDENHGVDEDATRTLGLIALYGSRDRAPDVAEAIEMFDSVLPVTHDSAGVMTDLSAAYMVLAAESQSIEALQKALEWSEAALELRPGYVPALFNRALALEALTADISARNAWRTLLAADQPRGIARYLPWSRSARWREEAAQRLRALEELGPPELPAVRAGEAVWRAFVREHPQQGRRYGWETLLPEWAAAVERGQGARADTLLRLAAVIGDAVYQRPHGDAMLHDQVSAIRAMTPGGGDVQRLAQAYRVEKAAADAKVSFRARADSLLSLLESRSLPHPQAIWVELNHAATMTYLSQWSRAGQALDSVDAQIDTLRYPVAAGYSRWLRGTIYSRTNDYARATAVLESARAIYDRIGERASRGTMEGFIADVQFRSGNADVGNDWSQRSARTMRALGPSVGLHNGRRLAAQSAQVAGLYRAMRDLANDDVLVAEAMGETPYIDEALLNRAALLAASGQKQRAIRDMERATPSDSIEPGFIQQYAVITRAYVRALMQLGAHPDSVAATVEPLLAYRGSDLWRTKGLVLRARAAVVLGDVARATEDLDSVFVAEEGRAKSGGGLQRQGVNDVRPALLDLVLLLAAKGDTVGSLRLLNRGAAALAPIQVRDKTLPRSVPADRVVIRPLRVGSTLLVWTMAGSRVEMTRMPVDSARLMRAISWVQYALPRSFDADEDRGYLYRLLVRPAERRLGRPADSLQVVFVHDADLGGIPFVALLDSAQRPLVMDHPVWSAVSLAAAAAPADTTLPASVAFFAPRFDPGLNPDLESLPRARTEVASAAVGYGSRVMSHLAQTPEGFSLALQRADVIHFAGHAVSDELRPDRSYLVLEPGSRSPTGHLTAAGLDTIPIRNVRLVVLSACSTLGGSGASHGFTGLSAALLDAGARGVVGSLWEVDDGPTAALMLEFHERYRVARNPQLALWEAQRTMLLAGDSTVNVPTVWAAFHYLGR